MGDVQLVLQTTSSGVERLAVIKRPRPEFARVPEFAAMFWEEARIAATLSHPNVVQTYEVGEDDEGSFLLLEYLRGQSYAEVLTRSRYADYALSLEVLLAVLQALEYAHRLKHPSGRQMALVHRDISPPNVFITYEGQIKVLDFGIAKALDSSVKTEVGMVKGKVSYMSPEQMLGAAVDLRTDLYAVGVMLWEATAGQQRFVDVSDITISSLVTAQRAPLSPGAVERGLPALADDICRRALAREPADRYASAAEFHEELRKLAELVDNRPPTHVIGQRVSALFAAERSAQQARIEADLSSTDVSNGAAAPPPQAEHLGARGTQVLALDNARIHSKAITATPAAARAATAPSSPAERVLTEPPPNGGSTAASKRRLAVFAALLVVLAFAGVKLGGALSGIEREATALASASAAALPTPPPLALPAVTPSLVAAPNAALAPSASATTKPKRLHVVRRAPDLNTEFGGRR
jgi:serine/threonine protein kinase